MKTIIISSVLIVLLLSCRTVQRATDNQITEYKHAVSTAQNTVQQKSQESLQTKFTNLASVTSSDNGIERLIEEEILEYSTPRRDSLHPDAISGKVISTTRKIRERGKSKDLTVLQSAIQDSLRQLRNSHANQTILADESTRQQQLRHQKLVRRTGVPWYVWAGSAVTISFSFWFGNKIRHNRSGYPNRQNRWP